MPTRSGASSCLSLAGLGALAALAGGGWGWVGEGRAVFRDGPPPAYTGGFGEPTCHACHADAPLNEASGTLTIEGLPDRYQRGRTYELEVTLRREEMRRAGFELAARLADGDAPGTQAGLLVPTDDRTAVLRDSSTSVAYLGHTVGGTSVVADGTGRWTFRWTAPAEAPRGAAVVFHIAANAANDDDSPLGDFVYARALRVPAGTTR